MRARAKLVKFVLHSFLKQVKFNCGKRTKPQLAPRAVGVLPWQMLPTQSPPHDLYHLCSDSFFVCLIDLFKKKTAQNGRSYTAR